MRNNLLSFGLAGIAVAMLSFTFIDKNDEVQDTKSKRHIKMMKFEDGKTIELDTVLTTDDVFVWHGDTIHPAEDMKGFGSGNFGKLRHPGVKVDSIGGRERVMIFRHKDGKDGGPIAWQMDSDDMEIITEELDSLGKRIIVRKRIQDGDPDHFIFLREGKMKHFPGMPPVPPAPPVPHVKMLKHSDRIIDLNDPSVVSFKKKDIGGNKEKIEIIREKPEKKEMPEHN